MDVVKDIYDSLAIILIFTTLLSNNIGNKADILLNEYIEVGKKRQLEKQYSSRRNFFYKEWLFILTLNFGLLYVLSPTAVDIFSNTRLDLITFNVTLTVYMFIYIILLYFMTSYFIMTRKLYKHIRKIKQALDKI